MKLLKWLLPLLPALAAAQVTLPYTSPPPPAATWNPMCCDIRSAFGIAQNGTFNMGGSFTDPGEAGATVLGMHKTLTGSDGTASEFGPIYFDIDSSNFQKTVTPRAVPAMKLTHNFTGTNSVGGFAGLSIDLNMNGTTGNVAAGVQGNYVGLISTVRGKANDGGVANTLGNDAGSIWGLNSETFTTAPATFWHAVRGYELGVGINTGSTVTILEGLKIAQDAQAQVQAVTENNALVIESIQNPPGWNIGLSFGGYDGYWPMASGGTLIGCYNHGNGGGQCGTTTNGVDLTKVTFTGSAFKSTGFAVDPNGIIGNSTPGGTIVIGGDPATYNSFTITPTSTGTSPSISATGVDANVNMNLRVKGTGVINMGPTTSNSFTVTTDGGVGAGGVWNFHSTGSGNNLAYVNVAGSDTNVKMQFRTKGSGIVEFQAPVEVTGTKFTVTGTGACATTSTTLGGAQSGSFLCTGTAGASTATITINGATGGSAANGWACFASDVTSGVAWAQSGTVSTTACTISGAIATTSDKIVFGAIGY